ncbi:MAG: chromosomal replication initiator protein DnaA [Clostridia bacterium]|nr:chromosomal replication initiator protein DnaA [Clostridia bacterium]
MSQSYLDEISDIWKMVRESFHSKLSRETIDLWFGELTVIAFENNTITLSTGSEFKLGVIKKRHLADIQKGFCDLLGFDINVDIVFNGKMADPRDVIQTLEQTDDFKKPAKNDYIKENTQTTPTPATSGYTFEYTFDNFIIGASNKFAHAACVAVADRPAINYNPLFIYGQSGLGKTHLMHAIINQLKRNNPNINIIYVKGDDFTNQLVESLKNNTPHQFREKYRKCDVLLIDDIQFIAGREATQEEFFHTFNSLFEEHKQIILTSDRPPRDIKTLEDRLLTRFEWGLIADIQPPDLELRIAIIKKKAEQVNIHLPDDVLMFLAENLRSNIRQIEGAIKKLGALIFLSGKELNMDLARSCISELLGGAEPVSVTVDKIFAAIFKKYGVKREDIVGARRTKEVAFARHVSIYLLRAITDMSFPNIGKIFNRDHSTIMSSIDTVERKLQADNMFSLELADLKKEITGQ